MVLNGELFVNLPKKCKMRATKLIRKVANLHKKVKLAPAIIPQFSGFPTFLSSKIKKVEFKAILRCKNCSHSDFRPFQIVKMSNLTVSERSKFLILTKFEGLKMREFQSTVILRPKNSLKFRFGPDKFSKE